MQKRRKNKGFTLVELLIVIIIIGILAGSLMLVAGGSTAKAKATKIISNLRTIKGAALLYFSDHDTWPSQISDITPYLDKNPGNSYAIHNDNNTGLYVFFDVNTEPDAADVKSKLTNSAQEAGLVGCDSGVTDGGNADINIVDPYNDNRYVGMKIK